MLHLHARRVDEMRSQSHELSNYCHTAYQYCPYFLRQLVPYEGEDSRPGDSSLLAWDIPHFVVEAQDGLKKDRNFHSVLERQT